MTDALCWTDSRYFIQAEKQLQEGWKMMKMKAGELMWHEYAIKHMQKGQKVAYDP
jgi:Xaa-Pro aminopeptidase